MPKYCSFMLFVLISLLNQAVFDNKSKLRCRFEGIFQKLFLKFQCVRSLILLLANRTLTNLFWNMSIFFAQTRMRSVHLNHQYAIVAWANILRLTIPLIASLLLPWYSMNIFLHGNRISTVHVIFFCQDSFFFDQMKIVEFFIVMV